MILQNNDGSSDDKLRLLEKQLEVRDSHIQALLKELSVWETTAEQLGETLLQKNKKIQSLETELENQSENSFVASNIVADKSTNSSSPQENPCHTREQGNTASDGSTSSKTSNVHWREEVQRLKDQLALATGSCHEAERRCSELAEALRQEQSQGVCIKVSASPLPLS